MGMCDDLDEKVHLYACVTMNWSTTDIPVPLSSNDVDACDGTAKVRRRIWSKQLECDDMAAGRCQHCRAVCCQCWSSRIARPFTPDLFDLNDKSGREILCPYSLLTVCMAKALIWELSWWNRPMHLDFFFLISNSTRRLSTQMQPLTLAACPLLNG